MSHHKVAAFDPITVDMLRGVLHELVYLCGKIIRHSLIRINNQYPLVFCLRNRPILKRRIAIPFALDQSTTTHTPYDFHRVVYATGVSNQYFICDLTSRFNARPDIHALVTARD